MSYLHPFLFILVGGYLIYRGGSDAKTIHELNKIFDNHDACPDKVEPIYVQASETTNN